MRALSLGLTLLAAATPHPETPSAADPAAALRAGSGFIATPVFSEEEDRRLLALFDGLRVADVTDGMDAVGLPNVGLMDPAIRPLWRDAKTFRHRFIGIAVTARYVPTNRPQAGKRPTAEYDDWAGDWYEKLSAEPFEALLRQGSALIIDDAERADVGSIGSPSIERAVQERLSACGVDRHVYWDRVHASPAELQALIEAVVVPETWFFRDREAFATLASIGHERWKRAPADGMLRLLSLPSSTGEEPYSMAMALVDAGVPADRFRIDGVDVSANAIASATGAIATPMSVPLVPALLKGLVATSV